MILFKISIYMCSLYLTKLGRLQSFCKPDTNVSKHCTEQHYKRSGLGFYLPFPSQKLIDLDCKIPRLQNDCIYRYLKSKASLRGRGSKLCFYLNCIRSSKVRRESWRGPYQVRCTQYPGRSIPSFFTLSGSLLTSLCKGSSSWLQLLLLWAKGVTGKAGPEELGKQCFPGRVENKQFTVHASACLVAVILMFVLFAENSGLMRM